MQMNFLQTEELNIKIDKFHEFSKDAMLEKAVLVASSFFCIATEIGFLKPRRNRKKQLGDL